jgi:agmatinase
VALKPPARPFLAAGEYEQPAVILIGAPLDLTESFRAGTAQGPSRIREVSDVLETYSPRLDADLAAVAFADWGDLELDAADMPTALGQIEAVYRSLPDGVLPIMMGGEHTVTIGAIRGLRARHPDLVVLQLDAHTDLRDVYEGCAVSHATVMRRIGDEIGLDHIAQFGLRSGTREEFELARRCLWSGPELALPRATRDRIHRRPVYVTIDIDVLDPSCAPGTGCPEPGGATFNELAAFLYSLQAFRVVGLDVVEVLPAADVNDVTSAAAAKLIREAVLLFGRSGPAVDR